MQWQYYAERRISYARVRRLAVRFLACAIVALATGVGSSPCLASTLFVAQNGDDTAGKGTQDQPYATLGMAVKNCHDGDTLLLRAGVYQGGVIIRQPNITIQSALGEHAKITSPVDNPKGGNNVWFLKPGGKVRNLELEGGYYYTLKFEAGQGLVENCRIHGSGVGDLLKIVPHADDMIIRRCEFYDAGMAKGGNSQGIDNVNGSHMLVQDCYIHDIHDVAAHAKGGAIGCIFERVFIKNCLAGIDLGQSTDQKLFSPTNPEFYENIDGTVRDCIIMHTDHAGIALYAALNPKVYNNTLIDVARKAQGGIFLSYSDHYPNGKKVAQANFNAKIYNNIVTLSAESVRPIVYFHAASVKGPLEIDHNRYFQEGHEPRFIDISKYPEVSAGFSGNLEQWKTRLNAEKHSSVGDPDLDAELHPKPGSPCRNAGKKLDESPLSITRHIGATLKTQTLPSHQD